MAFKELLSKTKEKATQVAEVAGQKGKIVLENSKEKASYVADIASQKSKEVYETSKGSVKTMELNSEIEAIYKEIGKLVYASHTGEDVTEEMILEKVNIVKAKNEEIAQIKERQDNLKNTIVCKTCQTIGRKDDDFCGGCGGKL